MDSALIVSHTRQSVAFFMEMLTQNTCGEIITVASCGEARRLLIERDFDLCIVNAPLPDEFGESFAMSAATQGVSQVVLVVKADLLEEVAAKVEAAGVFTIAKPIHRTIFWSVLKLADAVVYKMTAMRQANNVLQQKIKDIRIVDRAKCILMEYLRLTEAEAHKYIEKQAMDMRITKRAVAENILKTYEN